LDLKPDVAHVRARRGELLLDLGSFEEAAADFGKLLAANARDARAHFGMAQVASARRDPAAALRHLEAVGDVQPVRQRCCAQKVAAYELLGDQAGLERERARLARL